MKKIIVIVAVLLAVSGISGFAFAQDKKLKTAKSAQENLEVIVGKIVSIDLAKKEVVVKDSKTQGDRSFVVSEKAIAGVKVGDDVRIKVKSGSSHAVGVKVINPEVKKN